MIKPYFLCRESSMKQQVKLQYDLLFPLEKNIFVLAATPATHMFGALCYWSSKYWFTEPSG